MPRHKITIEYDGTGFVGWQHQENGPSVQAALTEALTRLSGEAATVFGAGRTDAGVHALGQVAHFDLARDWPNDKLRDGLNAHLRDLGVAIAVLAAKQVDDDFDARFSATRRHYRYRIVNRRAPLAIDAGRAWLVSRPLDHVLMHTAARRLIGKHDFTTFRSAHCQAKSPLKTLDRLEVRREGDDVAVTASARSFLHHQVRSIVGCLKVVGEGAWTADDLEAALVARDRSRCAAVAPARGLYLTGVDYEI